MTSGIIETCSACMVDWRDRNNIHFAQPDIISNVLLTHLEYACMAVAMEAGWKGVQQRQWYRWLCMVAVAAPGEVRMVVVEVKGMRRMVHFG